MYSKQNVQKLQIYILEQYMKSKSSFLVSSAFSELHQITQSKEENNEKA
jgi:hypothetical protein